MLSRHAILRRMSVDGPKGRGMRRLIYDLHTSSVFAIENMRLGHVDIARQENMYTATRAYRAIVRRVQRGEPTTAKITQAILAYEQARYLTRGG